MRCGKRLDGGFGARENRSRRRDVCEIDHANFSNQLAYNLIASVVSAQSGEHIGDNLNYRNYLGRLPPGRTEYRIEHPGHGMRKRFSVELAFEDSGSRTWVRGGKGALRQAKRDPLAFYGIDPPVSWLMP